MKFKLILFFLIFLLFAGITSAKEVTFGVPETVTQTVTTADVVTLISSANSATAWTKILGSDSTSAIRFHITNPAQTYDLKFTYNNSYDGTTYTTGVADYWLMQSDDEPIERYLRIPNGVYVNTTFSVIHTGTTAPSINVNFESQK